ncbi:MAG TPA: DUF4190 domain-containing protein [Candidatus Dormibacteraeota bacterium]
MGTQDTPAQIRTDSGAVAALVCGLVSLVGLVFPPLLCAGLAGVILGWTARKRIARSDSGLKGSRIAIAGLALGVLGTLLSLVIPGFIVGVWIYAAFHGGRLPYAS